MSSPHREMRYWIATQGKSVSKVQQKFINSNHKGMPFQLELRFELMKVKIGNSTLQWGSSRHVDSLKVPRLQSAFCPSRQQPPLLAQRAYVVEALVFALFKTKKTTGLPSGSHLCVDSHSGALFFIYVINGRDRLRTSRVRDVRAPHATPLVPTAT